MLELSIVALTAGILLGYLIGSYVHE